MKIDTNFNNVDSKTMGDFLEIGTYPRCKSVSAKWTKSRKGTLGLQITWEDAETKGVTNETRWLTAGTMPYFKGWAKDVLAIELDSDMINEKVFIGRYAKVVVKTQKNNPEYTETVSMENKELMRHNKLTKASQGADSRMPSDIQEENQSNSGNNNGGGDYINDDVPF